MMPLSCGIMNTIIFIFLMILQRCNAQSAAKTTQSYLEIGPRIVSGSPALNRNHRHLVFIMVKSREILNEEYEKISQSHGQGTLLTLKWALTAAHVVDKATIESIFAFAGMSKKTDMNEFLPTVQVQTVCQCVIHPKYKNYPDSFGGNHNVNDLAMLKFRGAFHNTVWVRAIGLPAIPDYTNNELDIYHKFENTRCVIAGFGKVNDPNVYKDQLQEAKLSLILPQICQAAEHLDPPTHVSVCAFDNHSSGYEGDSGTPLICDKNLIGVLSYGMFSTSVPKSERINVFTRADYWKGWIVDVVLGIF